MSIAVTSYEQFRNSARYCTPGHPLAESAKGGYRDAFSRLIERHSGFCPVEGAFDSAAPTLQLTSNQVGSSTGTHRRLAMREKPKVSSGMKWLPSILALLLAPIPAQSATGTINGTVFDPARMGVPGANVSAQNEDTGTGRKTITNEAGEYSLPALSPGSYRIEVTVPGFQTAVRDVNLQVDETLRVDVSLALEGQKTSVDVGERITVLETDTANLGQVIGRLEVAELPLNQRNFLAFALLAPGVSPPTYGSFTARQGGAINVDGGREQSNQFLLDGVDNSDPRLHQVSLAPPIEALDQFKVQSANAPAEFGRMSGGQIDMVLKSGTNSLHGSLFEFVRNRNLDARNYFDLPVCRPGSVANQCADKPALDRSQFGGSLGGPLVRDRAFYFVTYEGSQLRQGVTRQSTVPSIDDRAAVLQAVPISERSAAGMAILGLYPLANVGAGDPSSRIFVASPLIHDSMNQMLAKIDYRLGETATLAGHYALFDEQRVDPYELSNTFSSLPGFSTRDPRSSQHAAVGLTQTPNAHVVMETRFGWHAPRYSLTPDSQGRDLNATLGFPTIATNPLDYGYPSVAVVGFTSIGEGSYVPTVSNSTVFNLVHNTSIQPVFQGGKHLFQLGGSLLHSSQTRSAPLYARGLWNFNGNSTYSPLEQLVRGLPSSALVGQGASAVDLTTWSWSLYFSDSIRIGERLTVQSGLRYEFNQPPTNSGPPLTVPDFRPESAGCAPTPSCLFVPASVLGLPASTIRGDRNNFAPRLGLAWRPPGMDWMAVRAAYGMYYDNAALSLVDQYSFNPPFSSLSIYPGTGTSTIRSIIAQPAVTSLALAYLVDPNLRDAYVQQWNLNLQFALSHGFMLETAYVGSKGTRLPGATNPNQAPEGGGPRPFPQFGPLAFISSRASSNYESMQTRLERRFRAGSSFLANYTWSKSIDDASLYLGLGQAESYMPQDSRDLRSERALSTFDTRHRLSISYLQELPLPTHSDRIVRGIAGGWQFGLIASVNSGHPFPILRSIDQSGTVPGPAGDLSDRPDVVGDPYKAGPVMNNPNPACWRTVSQGGRAADKVGDPASWFNPCAFASPTTLRFGNSARNNVIGPGLANVDVSLAKRFFLSKERQTLQLRFEVFNLLNRPQFDLPENYFDSASFAAVSSANLLGTSPPRQIQIGMRFQF